MRSVRRALPFVLIVIGLWLLSGCIYVPMFNHTIGGKDATKYVGPSDSNAKLRVGLSSRSAVIRVLGKPFFATDDHRYVVYSWRKRKSSQIWPLCFTIANDDTAYAMTLEFDALNQLVASRVEHRDPSYYLFGVSGAKPFAPTDVIMHQRLWQYRDHPDLLRQLQAATQRSNRIRDGQPTTNSE